MLATDAYAFLDIDNPLCAWATYRGTLVSAPTTHPGFVSVWTAGILRANDPSRVSFELAIEEVRTKHFPHRISRLQGMFCLPDIESAKRACLWDCARKTHFQPSYLAELSLIEAGDRRDRLDANWITHAPINKAGFLTDITWIPQYWAGDPYPDESPTWETLVDGRLIVLGTDIRERAYAAIKAEFPESLMFLEIARQAAWIGSDLGAVAALLRREDGDIILDYAMNMVDADNPEFLSRLAALQESGHPINRGDMKPHIEKGSFGRVPDMRPYGFRRPINHPNSVTDQSVSCSHNTTAHPNR